jgi:hypothetical protein
LELGGIEVDGQLGWRRGEMAGRGGGGGGDGRQAGGGGGGVEGDGRRAVRKWKMQGWERRAREGGGVGEATVERGWDVDAGENPSSVFMQRRLSESGMQTLERIPGMRSSVLESSFCWNSKQCLPIFIFKMQIGLQRLLERV